MGSHALPLTPGMLTLDGVEIDVCEPVPFGKSCCPSAVDDPCCAPANKCRPSNPFGGLAAEIVAAIPNVVCDTIEVKTTMVHHHVDHTEDSSEEVTVVFDPEKGELTPLHFEMATERSEMVEFSRVVKHYAETEKLRVALCAICSKPMPLAEAQE